MSEAKPFASLSSGLLARKGAARPAMRPQGFGQAGAGLEDLGWNDMGFEPPKPATAPRDEAHDAFGEDIVEHPRALHPTGLTPVQSPVHTQQAEIADRFAEGFHDDDVVDGSAEDVDETAEIFEPKAVRSAAPEPESEPDFEPEPEPEPSPLAAVVPRPVEYRPVRPRSAAGSKAKAAFTLRLEPERHLKLRLACAVRGRSAQQLVTDALDHLLTQMPELAAMAEKANRKG